MQRVRCFLVVPTGATRRVENAHGHGEHNLYRRADGTPGEWTLAELPVGAMWYATWYDDLKAEGGPYLGGRPADGWLVVRLPNGHDWMLDMRASNCTLPNDNGHRCWVRHGDPPEVTVDKRGVTCKAGAGSIGSGSYHGFLRNGWLEP